MYMVKWLAEAEHSITCEWGTWQRWMLLKTCCTTNDIRPFDMHGMPCDEVWFVRIDEINGEENVLWRSQLKGHGDNHRWQAENWIGPMLIITGDGLHMFQVPHRTTVRRCIDYHQNRHFDKIMLIHVSSDGILMANEIIKLYTEGMTHSWSNSKLASHLALHVNLWS